MNGNKRIVPRFNPFTPLFEAKKRVFLPFMDSENSK